MGIETIRAFVLKAILLSTFVVGVSLAVHSQTRIEPYKAVEITLDSASPATVTFDASQGEAIEFVAKHRGISLSATVVSPKGKQVIFLVSPTLFTGTLRIPFKAKETGVHRLIFETERPGKTVGQLNVSYFSKRQPTPSDEEIFQAFKLISEAQEINQYLLNPLVNRSRRIVAKTNLEQAIAICEKQNDSRCVGMAAIELGTFSYLELGDFPSSESALRKAVQHYATIGDIAGESLSKGNLALITSLLKGRDSGVMSMLDGAIEQSEAINDPYLGCRLLTFKGRILRDWGEGSKGFEFTKRAVSLAGRADLDGLLRALIYTHSIAELLEDRAKDIYSDQIFQLADEIAGRFHPAFVPWILNQKSSYAVRRKDFKSYEIYTNKSIRVAESMGTTRLLGSFLWAAGSEYLDLKRYEKARPYLERAVKVYEEASPREAQAAYVTLGKYHLWAGNLSKARELFQKAVDLNEANQDKHAAILALNYLTDAQLKLGDFEVALSSAEKAYNYTLSLRGSYYTSVALNGFDLTFLRNSSERMISVLYNLYEKSGNISYLERALEIQDLTLSRSLINNVRSSGFDITSAVDTVLLQKVSDIQDRISATQLRIQNNDKQKAELKKVLLEYLVEYDEVLDQIRKKNPTSLLFSELLHLSAGEIRDLLDDQTVLIQYSVKLNESHAWVIGKEKSRFYKLPAPDVINKLAKSYSAEISDYSKNAAPKNFLNGRKLAEAILNPILNDISGHTRIVIVPDGELVATQFAALPVVLKGTSKYLAEEVEIGILPSVSTLIALRQINESKASVPPNNLLAVFADPVFDPTDTRLEIQNKTAKGLYESLTAKTLAGSTVKALTRLPFTSVEGRSITQLAPTASRTFSGLEAKRDTVISGSISDYRIVHFATHGFLNDSNPELSALALSMYDASGKPQNGFLRALDIYSLRLKADLVVLGGCQTAGVSKIRGDGLSGLTRGFMYAGVPTVMASFWKVDDSATSYFMRYFYEGLLEKGMTPTAALREAQLRFIKSPRWSSPKYWAAFTVQGEYDVRFK